MNYTFSRRHAKNPKLVEELRQREDFVICGNESNGIDEVLHTTIQPYRLHVFGNKRDAKLPEGVDRHSIKGLKMMWCQQ